MTPYVLNDTNYTIAHFYHLGTVSRTLIDRNFVFTDGSARTLFRLAMFDPRTVEVRHYSSPIHSNSYAYLPADE